MSSSYITNSLIFRRSWLILSLTVASILAAEMNAQRIAVITPDNSAVEGMLAAAIADSVPGPGLNQDLEMSRTAVESAKIEHPFKMTTERAVGYASPDTASTPTLGRCFRDLACNRPRVIPVA